MNMELKIISISVGMVVKGKYGKVIFEAQR
jgi:hypothetical protein